MSTQEQIREKITCQIIEALEKGGLPPWRHPWKKTPNTGSPTNICSQNAYRGINPLLLSLHQQKFGFRSKWYGTYKQWADLGGKVMHRPSEVPPGEWGCSIIYYCEVKKTEADRTTGEEVERKYPLLKSYSVFSIDQVEGDCLDHLRAKDDVNEGNEQFVDYEPAELAIQATEADIRLGGNDAFYCRSGDYIQMPPKGKFQKENEFYSTCLHELAHWSESRTEWKGDYAEGELRAEISAAFMLAELGVPQSSDLTNHQTYIANWLKALKNDNRYIFKASAAASKAADFVLSFSRQPINEPIEVAF